MRTLIILLALLVVAGLAEQPAIAIIDLEAKLCAKDLADAVSDILRTEVIDSGRFRVIERAQLAEVIKEHAFQLSGMVDESTIAEFGKLVGADYVALGSVSVLGGTYTVTLRFIDVETAEAVLGKTESTNSQSGLPDVCRRLAAALTGLPYSGTSGDDGSSTATSSTGDDGSSSAPSSSGRIAGKIGLAGPVQITGEGAGDLARSKTEIIAAVSSALGPARQQYNELLKTNPNASGSISIIF
ncbi:MAG: hypothetical protein NTW26_03070, partial [bacterium]|nr:hypothetical protein [bacterium]